jgi:hypothetical protein
MKSLMKFALVKALLFLMTTGVAAQTASSIVTQGFDRTAFLIQPNQRSVISAGFDGSFGLTPLFNIPGLIGFSCLQPAGTKCIYRISVETNIALSSQEIVPTYCVSAIHFLVDGHAPTPGPRGSSGPGADSGGLEGLFTQTVSSTSSSSPDFRPYTISVIAVVTNTVSNQLHAINLDLWVGSAASQCSATANGALATIQVFH